MVFAQAGARPSGVTSLYLFSRLDLGKNEEQKNEETGFATHDARGLE